MVRLPPVCSSEPTRKEVPQEARRDSDSVGCSSSVALGSRESAFSALKDS